MTNEERPDRLARLRKGWKFIQLFEEIASPTTLLALLAALVLAVVGLFGGWQRVRAVEVVTPTANAGEAVSAAPLSITIVDAWLADPAPDSLSANSRAVLVRGTVTNTSSAPVSALTVLNDAVRLELDGCQRFGLPQDPADCPFAEIERTWDVETMVGLGRMGSLQPGVETGFLMTFTQPKSAAAPTQARITVNGATWRRSSLDGQMNWFDPTPVAELTLPLQKWTPGKWGK